MFAMAKSEQTSLPAEAIKWPCSFLTPNHSALLSPAFQICQSTDTRQPGLQMAMPQICNWVSMSPLNVQGVGCSAAMRLTLGVSLFLLPFLGQRVPSRLRSVALVLLKSGKYKKDAPWGGLISQWNTEAMGSMLTGVSVDSCFNAATQQAPWQWRQPPCQPHKSARASGQAGDRCLLAAH